MTTFDNKNLESPISAIEFVGEKDSKFIVLHARTRTEEEKLAAWMKKNNLDGREITRTHVDGHDVVIVQSAIPQSELMQSMQAQGEQLSAHVEQKKANLWKLRGWASNIGQPLQFLSGMFSKKGIDGATVAFAALNMTANTMNIIFGAERKDDTHRMHYLKTDINRDLDEHLKNGEQPLDPNQNRADLREKDEPKKSAGAGLYDFMKGNSVRIGEIGLRYLGSIALAFPLANWKAGGKELAKGSFKGAYDAFRNKDKGTFNAGAAYLVGKTIAFGSKIPDPYDPTPPNMVDSMREKILFPASSVIETVAAGCIAYDRLTSKSRKIIWPKWTGAPKTWQTKGTQDYLGGVGGLLFMGGLIIRIFAPFGKRELDMDEMTAHITDTLIKTPREEMPRLLADSAATVFEHTRDKGVSFGEIFASMAQDMSQYYHISLNTPKKDGAPLLAEAPAPSEDKTLNFADHTARKPEQVGQVTLAKPAASHTERHMQGTGETAQLSV